MAIILIRPSPARHLLCARCATAINLRLRTFSCLTRARTFVCPEFVLKKTASHRSKGGNTREPTTGFEPVTYGLRTLIKKRGATHCATQQIHSTGTLTNALS